jgi:hypothetical protein
VSRFGDPIAAMFAGAAPEEDPSWISLISNVAVASYVRGVTAVTTTVSANTAISEMMMAPFRRRKMLTYSLRPGGGAS